MSTLTKAIILAARSHDGQTDKGGSPYLFHPIRLMLKALNEEERIVAILHDTVEQTELTLYDLRKEGFSEAIVEAVDRLTRRDDESYADFIWRIKENPLARRVKIYDLQDNIDQYRHRKPSEKIQKKLKKYSDALDTLLGYGRGNQYDDK